MKIKDFSQRPDLSEFTFIDVRPQKFFDEGHVQGAINIDWYDSKYKEKISQLDTNGKYAVYCDWGCRSDEFADVMKNEFKFEIVIHIEGGTEEINDMLKK